MLILYLSGPEEARTSGWSSMDRRRAPLPITSVGTLSKQKAPVGNDATVSRDAVVSCHYCPLFIMGKVCKMGQLFML